MNNGTATRKKKTSVRPGYEIVWLTAILVALIVLAGQTQWRGSRQLHTMMEVTGCLLVLFAGVLAGLRYYTKRNDRFLFLAVGFFGTFLLDGYHAVVTSDLVSYIMPSPPENLIPWSWNASRTFLSILMAMSWWAWRDGHSNAPSRYKELGVAVVATVLTLISFFFFAFVPLPRAHYPELFFGRPAELVAAAIFLVALVGYIRKGRWREDSFEYWLIISLVIGFVSQALAMPRSFGLFDPMFDSAHLLKLFSYVAVLMGLLLDSYNLYRSVETGRVKLQQHQRQLMQHAAELERSNRELDEFAYVASHDLKSPLRAIDSLADFVIEDAGDTLPTGCQDDLRLMKSRIKRMEGLLNGLLEYSRVGRKEGKFTEVPVDEVVEEVLALQDLPDGFEVAVKNPLPVLHGPRAAIEKVFRNLINNAVKHRERDDGRVEISVEDQCDFYEFTVRDNGRGIAPEQHEQCFMMFRTFRRRDEVEGSGIGLALVKKTLETHGGSVSLESEAGHGAAFRFTWPKATIQTE